MFTLTNTLKRVVTTNILPYIARSVLIEYLYTSNFLQVTYSVIINS